MRLLAIIGLPCGEQYIRALDRQRLACSRTNPAAATRPSDQGKLSFEIRVGGWIHLRRHDRVEYRGDFVITRIAPLRSRLGREVANTLLNPDQTGKASTMLT